MTNLQRKDEYSLQTLYIPHCSHCAR